MFHISGFKVRLMWIIFHTIDGTPFMAQQVKSRKRVQDHGEVFTNEREVNAMLDMVKQGLDKHGRPKHRKFLFPNAFDQGLLTL